MRFSGLIGLLMACSCVNEAGAQSTGSLPFSSGERLAYRVRADKFGTIGHAVMTVSGPVSIRGTETMLVSMDTRLGFLFMKGSDANRSWIDPRRMASLQFEKHQRRPFSRTDDRVEIYPALQRWNSTQGDSGSTSGPAPLDELSFIYFLRTVNLAPDSVYAFDRHYDKRRVPSTVRFVKRETVRTPAGEFSTVELEVQVKDGADWKGEWTVRVWISDDPCHLPVQMASALPIIGTGYMTLESAVTPMCGGTVADALNAGEGSRR